MGDARPRSCHDRVVTFHPTTDRVAALGSAIEGSAADPTWKTRPMSSPQRTPTTFEIQGRTVAFPIEVRLARMANAVYTVPAEAVADLVDPAFEIAADAHGAATLVLGFVDYVDNDLGDYDEVLFSVMARTADGDHEGSFIWRLPVNQEFTREAGVRMLGLPKTVEEIEIARSDESVTCTLRSDGELVLRQTFPMLSDVDPVPMPSPTVCLSRVGDRPAVSISEPGGGLRMAFGATGYGLELGPHPWGRELADIGLDGAAPTVVTVCDDWRATFLEPKVLGRPLIRRWWC